MLTLSPITRHTPPPQTPLRPRLCGAALSSLAWLAIIAALLCPRAIQAQTNLPVIVADFNHDGVPDALLPSATEPTATVVFGAVPYGTFSATSKLVTFPQQCVNPLPPATLLAGDFNGDGLADIFFTCGDGEATSGIMLGNGDGTFQSPQLFNALTSATAVLGDFNHDGKLDLAVVGMQPGQMYPGIQVFSGNGDGTVAAGAFLPFLVTSTYTSLAVADINGDGYPDLLLIGSIPGPAPIPTLNVFGNNKNGTFGVLGSPTTYAPNGTTGPTVAVNLAAGVANSILTGAFFSTTSVDVVVPGIEINTGFYAIKNTSSPTNFSLAAPVFTAYPGLLTAVAGSFTGSGYTDVVAANGASLTVLANNGAGSFAAGYTALTLASPTQLFAVADANGDGYTDIYTAIQLEAGGLQVAVNLVTGSATATSQPVSLPSGTQPITATWHGNVNFTGATANNTEIVNGVATLTAVISTENPSNAGDTITLSATATPAVISIHIPTGMMVITDGATTLASGLVNASGTFAFTTSALTVGTHTIQATYAGDTYFAGSLSPQLSQVVKALVPTLTWTPAVSSIVFGTALGAQQLNATATGPGGVTVPGVFVYTPATGAVLGAGPQPLSVTFTPTSSQYAAITGSAAITVTQATPTVTWPAPAAISYGTPLSATQLDATVTGVGGVTLPGTLTYTPPLGTVLSPGTQTLNVSFLPLDAVDYAIAKGSVSLVVSALTLASISPNTANLGDPNKTITLTGTGFLNSSQVLLGGAAVATTFVSSTTLTAVIPAANFAAVAPLQIAVTDPSLSITTPALPLTVAPPAPAVTLTGSPTSSSGSQPNITFTVVNPYPVALTVTLNLNFAPSVTPAVDDPMVQFSSGGRTLTFVVPANSTTVPAIQVQAGTTAGTITIPATLIAAGLNVTPGTLQPVVIVVPAAIPSITSASFTASGDTITVVIEGFSNTREVQQAAFHFTAASGDQIDTPNLTLPVPAIFTTWYSSAASDAYGTSFTYTQIFNTSDSAASIGSVQVTLTNTVGVSPSQTAQ